MRRTLLFGLAGLFALVPLGCQSDAKEVRQTVNDPAPAQTLADAQHSDWGWELPIGTFVSGSEGDGSGTVEMVELRDGYGMTRTLDGPGEENDGVMLGTWQQSYDGVRLQYSRVNGERNEGEAYFRYDVDSDSITEKTEGSRRLFRASGSEDSGQPE